MLVLHMKQTLYLKGLLVTMRLHSLHKRSESYDLPSAVLCIAV